MLVLGIESSCDETAAAVVRDGREILSSIIASQVDLHRSFGGVVPELASREHLENIRPVVRRSLTDAGVDLSDIDAVAVTQGPGLIGALHVGVSYAKALAYGLNIPVIGVNHIEGHVFSATFDKPEIQYPALALIVSGGHTNLFHVPEAGQYQLISRTRDDAAGEAFDKVAKMLGLGYPGGPAIEALAHTGNAEKIKFTRPKISDGKPDFSFSGLKTAVARYLRESGAVPPFAATDLATRLPDLAAGFQKAVIDSLVGTMKKQAGFLNSKTLIVAGGVACNAALRTAASAAADDLGLPVYFPPTALTTDNAAMIAAAGHFHLIRGERSNLNMSADVTLRLQNVAAAGTEYKSEKVRYRL